MAEPLEDAMRVLLEVLEAGAQAFAGLAEALGSLPPDGDGGEPMPLPRAA